MAKRASLASQLAGARTAPTPGTGSKPKSGASTTSSKRESQEATLARLRTEVAAGKAQAADRKRRDQAIQRSTGSSPRIVPTGVGASPGTKSQMPKTKSLSKPKSQKAVKPSASSRSNLGGTIAAVQERNRRLTEF